jgi:hypothetical protein
MTAAERAHKAKLAELGCLACLRIHGPHVPAVPELHHFRGGGWGKGNYRSLMGLCFEHHRGQFGIHGIGTKAFDAYYGGLYGFTQLDLLADAHRLTGL